MLLGFIVIYWVFIWFYWVLLGFTGFYWVLLGFTGFYWVLLGFIGLAFVFLRRTANGRRATRSNHWLLLMARSKPIRKTPNKKKNKKRRKKTKNAERNETKQATNGKRQPNLCEKETPPPLFVCAAKKKGNLHIEPLGLNQKQKQKQKKRKEKKNRCRSTKRKRPAGGRKFWRPTAWTGPAEGAVEHVAHPFSLLLGFTGFYWVLLGFTGLHRVEMAFTGLRWVSTAVWLGNIMIEWFFF